jgi:hypothetical protein
VQDLIGHLGGDSTQRAMIAWPTTTPLLHRVRTEQREKGQRKRMRGTAGITTAMPRVAGQWGRGNDRLSR